jgi:hypothetical protein
MPSYSPELIHTMRSALDAVMTQVPMNHATPGLKAYLAEPAGRRTGPDKPRWLGSRSIGPDSNDYLDAHLKRKSLIRRTTRTALTNIDDRALTASRTPRPS